MEIYSKDFTVETSKRRQVINITGQVEEAVKGSGIADGMVLVFTHHTTTALALNEDEEGLKRDLLSLISLLYDREGYLHDRIDNNASSHLAAVFAGPSLLLPLRNGRIIRGTWQSILLLELDGPRTRRITVQVMGRK